MDKLSWFQFLINLEESMKANKCDLFKTPMFKRLVKHAAVRWFHPT
jgi:hypothetical protein